MSGPIITLRSPRLRLLVFVSLAAVALLGSLIRLVPPLCKRARLQRVLSTSLENRLARQALYPLFTEISSMEQVDTFKALIPPVKIPLRQEDVATVSAVFEQLAERHGFAVGMVSVRVISELPRRQLSVELPLDGAYGQFGGVLKDLLRLPSLESIDRITVLIGDSLERINVEFKLALE